MSADRDGLVILIADFHRENIVTIRLDPELDGSGGEEIGWPTYMDFAESLKDPVLGAVVGEHGLPLVDV